jgi:hypothetical protein
MWRCEERTLQCVQGLYFPTLVDVFDDLYEGKINNIEAKDRLVVLFEGLKKLSQNF